MKRKEWKRLLTASMAALVLTSAVPIHAYENIEQQSEEQQEGTKTEEERDTSEQLNPEEQSEKTDKCEIEEESESQSKTEQETETKSQSKTEQETEEESELQSMTEQETEEESELQSKTEQETETETEADDMLIMFANEILEEDDVVYEDGTYEGTSTGYHNGKITVSVTIKDHKIEKVDVIEKDKQSWWNKKDVDSWIAHFLGLKTKKEVSEVDTIASATKSTTGVKNAILDALSKAPVVEENEQIFDSGDGSEENPYVIETKDNLYAFAKSCEEGEVYEGQYIVLSEDITLTEDWNPIQEFAGSFDGDGHSISHVRIGNEEEPLLTDCAGFFARLSHCAEIRDVHLEDVKIFVQSDDTVRGYAGGIAGYSGISRDDQIIIDGCSVEGTLISARSNVYAYAGGITAYASMGEVSITNSYTDIEVKAENERGMAMAGGIAAIMGNESFTMNCAALGKVYAKGANPNSKISSYAGGLMAMPSGLVYNCYSVADVTVHNTTPAEEPSIGSAFGMIPANALISNVYYGEHAGITIDGNSSDSRFSGKSMGKVRNAVSVSEINTEAFATKMEKALSTAEKSSMDIYMQDLGYDEKEFLNTYCNKAIWQGWKLENGKVILSGEAYVEKEQISIFEQGDGTKENPYVIADKDQFMKFADSFSESTDYAGEYIELGQNIDVSETEWNPLGQKENGYVPFKGHFNGKGHEIRGIRIGDKEQLKEDSYHMYYGLFTELGENAVVCNLAVTDVAIYVEGDASIMAGAIAGSVRNATVDNCQTDGTIVVKTINSRDGLTGANSFGGGIAGYAMYSNIVNCQTDVDIDVFCRTANAEAGGIAGFAAFGVVANCVSFGDVAGETDRTVDDGGVTYLSGIIGCNAQQIANCYQTGDIISRSWTIRAGGISGMATGISKTSYNYYNADAIQMINGEKINPVEGIGQIVGSGVGEDGAYDGAIEKENVAKDAEFLGSQDMADLMNSNFEHFPIDTSVLPEGTTLKKWIVKDGVVTLGTETASVTYVKLEQPKPPVIYMDGMYYGRSAFDTSGEIIVAVRVENGIIAEITLERTPEGFDQSVMGDIIQSVLEQQELDTEDIQTALENDVRTESVIAFKNAIQVALGKALIGDLTGYGRVNPQEVFAGGEGTKEKPYQIATADQLMKFAMSVNEDENYNGQYVVLTNDIDLKGYAWMPAGSAGAHPFSGNFDGQSHIINNMKIGTEEKAAHYFASGLFSYASGAVISNVGINDAYVHVARSDSNRAYAGIVVGAIDDDNTEQKGTVINNCSVKGTIINSAQSWSDSGGITGYVCQGLIMNCMADVVIEGTSSSNYVEAGGIAGLGGYSALYNNYAKGSIHATAGVNSASIGGIIGMNGGTAVNNTADVELVSTHSSIDIGGITGRNTGIALINGGYFSSDTLQKSGDTTLENEAVGTNVTMASTGIIKNAEGKTSQELKSEEFIKLLNDNISMEDMQNNIMQAITDYPLVIGGEMPNADRWQMSNNIICLKKAVLYQEDKKTQEENTDDKKQENTGTSSEQTNTKEYGSSKKKHASSKNKNTASNAPNPAIINESAPVNVDTVVNSAEVNVDTTKTPVETDNLTTIAPQEIPKEVIPASIQNEAAALRENRQAYVEETQNEIESVKEPEAEETDDKKEEKRKEDESKGQQIKIEEQETSLADYEGTNNRIIWFIIAVLLVGAAAGSYIIMNKKHIEK